MKYFYVFLSLFAFLFGTSSATSLPSINKFTGSNESTQTLNSFEEWVEYMYSEGKWYKITHYEDGTIGVVEVLHPPDD